MADNLFNAVREWLRFDNQVEPPDRDKASYAKHVEYETAKMAITEKVAEATNPRVTDTHKDGSNAFVFEPWTDGHAIGFQVTRVHDNKVGYVYLCPSQDTYSTDVDADADAMPNKGFNPDVFIYTGTAGEPDGDNSHHFYNIDFGDNEED